jgi:hypothetical protein
VHPLFISFYTPIYRSEADGLLATLAAFGLSADVRLVESQGSWVRNCARKADFIAEMMDEYPGRPLVWLDADARVRQWPELLFHLDCDFAAHWKGGTELLSGTLYFGGTDAARRLVQPWAAMCRADPDVWDQKHLQRVVGNADGLRVDTLPAPYVLIFDLMKDEGPPVIEHLQASRKLKDRQ